MTGGYLWEIVSLELKIVLYIPRYFTINWFDVDSDEDGILALVHWFLFRKNKEKN
jgi:hypothetical protein